eukprot:scaffold10094_cov128-Isochrysis_galbana.AAC.3
MNKALTTLECALASLQLQNVLASLSARADSRDCSLFGPRSLSNNSIGWRGAKHIGEGLKINTALTTLMCAPSFPPPQAKMRSLCCQQGVTVFGSSLFGPHSLWRNRIGDQGAQHIGEGLKNNKALTTLKCALASPPSQFRMCLLCCQQGLTVCGCSLFGPRSLFNNNIGAEGARCIGEALKMNTALTTLECALASLQLQNVLASLSAGELTLIASFAL